jgi:hypothetical protein
MTRVTGAELSERIRLPSAKDRFWVGNRKKVPSFFAGTLFWEEPEKWRAAPVPQVSVPQAIAVLSWMEPVSGL